MGPAATSDPKAQKILAAVRTVLSQQGYRGTTISLVAREAGVSRGLLHYYFKNKDEMLARVIKDNLDTSIALIRRVFVVNDTPEGYARGISGLLRGVMENDPAFMNLFFEGIAVARHSGIVNRELAELYGKFRKAMEACLIEAQARRIITPALPVVALAAIITSIIDGMGLQMLTEADLCQNQVIWDSMEIAIVDLLCGDR